MKTFEEKLKTLLSSQRLAVLATSDVMRPHTSLVAYAVWGNLEKILFVTPTTTRKYKYLKREPFVSMLIHSGLNQESDIYKAAAVTIKGFARELNDTSGSAFRDAFLQRHPYLEDFVRAPTSAMVALEPTLFSLVQNFQQVEEWVTDHGLGFHDGTRA